MARKIRWEPFIGAPVGAVLGFFAGGFLIWWQYREIPAADNLGWGYAIAFAAVWGGLFGLLVGAAIGYFISLKRRNH